LILHCHALNTKNLRCTIKVFFTSDLLFKPTLQFCSRIATVPLILSQISRDEERSSRKSARAGERSVASAGGIRQVTAEREEGGFRPCRRAAAAAELSSERLPPSVHRWSRGAAQRASVEVAAVELAAGRLPLQSTHQGRSPVRSTQRGGRRRLRARGGCLRRAQADEGMDAMLL
jgi:hypothetical protein